MSIIIKGGVIVFGFLVLFSSIISFIDIYNLAVYERGGTHKNVLSPFNAESFEYVSQMRSLLDYNVDRDHQRLLDYVSWSKQYLENHFDKNVYRNLILISKISPKNSDEISLDLYLERASVLFPDICNEDCYK
ncbi:hypothetical protein [Enterobacter kobei]|uniref:hypothetical protein n=1 Tax=Enterobacter kobei TaxID=208224 RepID=UPI002FD6F678